MGYTKRTLEEAKQAVIGSGGIKKTIADRLKVDRHTVDNYLERWATLRELYDQECEISLDVSENIILANLRLLSEMQGRLVRIARELEKEEGRDMEALSLLREAVMDTADARWMLTMKGGDRGYAPKQRQEISGKDGKPLIPDVVHIVTYGKDDGDGSDTA